MTVQDIPAREPGSLNWPGYTLGFALGGFFDGILLHQVLQWHHLLSGIEASAFRDIRVQILADGIFHALMYVVAAIGLALLWRARHGLALPLAGRKLASAGLIGFGAWHVIDTLLSHWITGIHRIRMDSDMPLFWDLLWLVVFGIVPLVIGWTMRSGGGGGRRLSSGRVAASVLVLAVLAAAPVSALPPRDVTGAIVLFRPGMSQGDIMAAVQSVGGRMVWADDGGIWALDFDDPAEARRLYAMGALLVSNSLFPAGCLTWLRAA